MNEPRTLHFGDIEVYENGKENETVTISLRIPLRADYCGRREQGEYRKLALEDMRVKATVLFQIVEYFGYELSSGNSKTTFADFIFVCGQIGQALMETQDIIEMSFNKEAEVKK